MGPVRRPLRRGRAAPGVECLSGIPGSVGATPIQNVGAYGQEVRETIVSRARATTGATARVESPARGAAASPTARAAFKRGPGRWVVLAVAFALRARRPLGADPLPGARARARRPAGRRARWPTCARRCSALRRGKGMVHRPGRSRLRRRRARSSSTRCSTPAAFARARGARARAPGRRRARAALPAGRRAVKTSAAWLIERAGFARGHGDPGAVAISAKHTLALTNRGAGTTGAARGAGARDRGAGGGGVRGAARARAGVRRARLELTIEQERARRERDLSRECSPPRSRSG